jgi:L-threonylcarbamoyladenylate synthase
VITCPDNDTTRKLAAEIVSTGGLIAFRTDTFYGLGADPLNRLAVGRINRIKGRAEGKPILLLIADISDVDPLVLSRPPLFEELSRQLWPGPLTIVLPANADLPDDVTSGTGSVGLRLPDDADVRALVHACGGRLTATSANPSGREPASSAAQVQEYFPSGIDLVIDGGPVTATAPSTVIDITCNPPRIIREGAVSRSGLAAILGQAVYF